EHRQRCLAEGMKAFLVKPIDRKVLVETVAAWLAPPPTTPERSVAQENLAAPASDAPASDGSASDDSPSNWQAKLLRTAGGDPATVQALVEAFLTEVPQLCQDLQTAVQTQDAALARRTA